MQGKGDIESGQQGTDTDKEIGKKNSQAMGQQEMERWEGHFDTNGV